MSIFFLPKSKIVAIFDSKVGIFAQTFLATLLEWPHTVVFVMLRLQLEYTAREQLSPKRELGPYQVGPPNAILVIQTYGLANQKELKKEQGTIVSTVDA